MDQATNEHVVYAETRLFNINAGDDERRLSNTLQVKRKRKQFGKGNPNIPYVELSRHNERRTPFELRSYTVVIENFIRNQNRRFTAIVLIENIIENLGGKDVTRLLGTTVKHRRPYQEIPAGFSVLPL